LVTDRERASVRVTIQAMPRTLCRAWAAYKSEAATGD